MDVSQGKLFGSVAGDDFLRLFDKAGAPDGKRIAELLDYQRKDVSAAAELPLNQVRLEPDRMPRELEQRVSEWGVALNLVAGFFRDEKKTVLWFRTPNPMLGNITPRDMIRVGRFKKLLLFIQPALDENKAE